MRDFSKPGRSLVYGREAMCATSHPLATLAALEMLREGGNAVDAAITAAAVLAIAEPHMTGIGGDCFALLWVPGEGLKGFNGSGRAPAGIDPDALAARGWQEIPLDSAEAVTVPGAVDAWDRLLSAHGTQDLARVLAPAIRLAETGVPVAPRVAFDWAMAAEALARDPQARRELLKDGAAPGAGDVMAFPALARTLRAVAEGGRDAFYAGPIAEDMVATLRARGGVHTLEDFAAHQGMWVTPIATAYEGLEVVELPPNGQGATALLLLNILARLDLGGAGPVSARRFHLQMEAARLAYAARDAFIADPDKADVPLAHMLSGALADSLAARIDPGRRTPDLGRIPPPPSADTVYLAVVDRDGMAVSFINSLYKSFGSTIVTERTGIVLHNRGACFSLAPGHPNRIAPGKRPMHTIIPAMALEDGAPALVFGVMGGAYQPVGHAHVLANMRVHGMDPQEALDCPRMFFEGDRLHAETGVPEPVLEELRAMGHDVGRAPVPWGGGQIIAIDRARGVLQGASDARKDGMAAGY